ncbi:MAG: hypothetical protein KBD46_03095 [Candidatus Levybacteria bacterium]|nr:hypothetical protein [Candidatus Levybacteria bacterium]
MVLLILVVPTSVSAHVLENNGSIGAVLHIDPADDPIAKAQSILFFSFKDKANTFKLSECECVFTVSAEKNVLYTQPLTSIDSNSENDAVVSYSFPEKNVYTLTVSGKPSRENTFKPFTLSYTIRVEQEIKKTDVQNSPSIPILPLVIFCVAILFVFAMIRRRKQK